MAWVAVAAWIAAIVVAVIVLGFCAYELRWKAVRLRADLQRLTGLSEQLAHLQQESAAVQERIARLDTG